MTYEGYLASIELLGWTWGYMADMPALYHQGKQLVIGSRYKWEGPAGTWELSLHACHLDAHHYHATYTSYVTAGSVLVEKFHQFIAETSECQ